MRKTLLLLPLLFCRALPAQTSTVATPLVIRDVTVIDGTGAKPRPAMTVVIRNGKIAELGEAARVKLPAGVRVIDGRGKFLIPGLWDMHGHLTDAGEGALAQLIENGVTGVRDLGGDLELVRRWRRDIDQGKRIGPHIVAAGPMLDGPTKSPWHVVANNEAEARSMVRSIKQRGADFLKTHTRISREAFYAAVGEAKKQGMQAAVHLPQALTTAEASDAGANSLEHVEMLVQSALMQQDSATKKLSDDERFAAALESLSGENGAALWARLVKNHTWYVPTMVAYERGFVLWSNKPTAMLKRRPVHWKQIDIVGAMHKAGVKVLAGSDFSDWAGIPGVDLHNELALMVEAGFSPMEALLSATSLPAEFLGKTRDFGTVEAGKVADLVLLDADPMETISHTRKIRAVIVGGKFIDVVKMRDAMISR